MRIACLPWKRWRWLLLLPAFAALHAVASELPIDRHNVAMRAPGSPDAEAAKALRARFGEQDPIVLAFCRADGARLSAGDLRAIDRHVAELEDEPGAITIGGRESPKPEVAVVAVETERDSDALRLATIAATDLPQGLRCVAGGLPLVEQEIASAIAGDRDRIVPILAAVLFALLAAMFRSVLQAACGLVPAVAAVLIVGALRATSGAALNPITVLLDPVLLTVAVAASVHVLASFRRFRADGMDPRAAATATRADLLRPASLATLTTMLGFWSLAFHPIPAVSEFGAWAGFGTGVAHAFLLLMLPRLLADLAAAPAPAEGLVDPARYLRWLRRARRPVLLGCLVSAAVAAAALTAARVDNDPMSVLPPENARKREWAELAGMLGGGDRFGLLVEHAPSVGVERLMLLCAEAATTWPAVGLAGRPLLSPSQTALVPVLLAPSGSSDRCNLFDALATKAAAVGIEGVRPAGTSVQIARDSQRLVHGQLAGLAATCAMLALALAAALRSVRAGLVGMIPNLLPCLWLYGGIALLDRPLSVANAMIGSVMLGLVVDNTIHVMHRFREQAGAAEQRVAAALRHTLSPMLVSSAVLAAGLGTGALGDMQSTKDFAALAATTILLALVGDAVLLPAMLLRPTAAGATA